MRCNRRGKLQRRSQKRFLQSAAVRAKIARRASCIVEQHSLIRMSRVIVFRREDSTITGGLPAQIQLLFDQDAKGVAHARVRVKIQIPSEYFSQADREFRRFSGVGNCIEERTANISGDSYNIRVRWN